jgi:hypothetical protein
VWNIASVTGWGYREIMEEVPIFAGLQIIDADLYVKGIHRYYRSDRNFDSAAFIDNEINKLNGQ